MSGHPPPPDPLPPALYSNNFAIEPSQCLTIAGHSSVVKPQPLTCQRRRLTCGLAHQPQINQPTIHKCPMRHLQTWDVCGCGRGGEGTPLWVGRADFATRSCYALQLVTLCRKDSGNDVHMSLAFFCTRGCNNKKVPGLLLFCTPFA